MARLGLNVPPGFVIATTECAETIDAGDITAELWGEVEGALAVLEKATGKVFGSAENPLLLSVRSGAAVSMPGMMNTVLGLGICGDDLSGLEQRGEWEEAEKERGRGGGGEISGPAGGS
jgi:pyruvate,orthophosphate dikinase